MFFILKHYKIIPQNSAALLIIVAYRLHKEVIDETFHSSVTYRY